MSCTETRESAIICHTPRDRQLHCSLVHLSGNKNRTQTSYPDVGTAPILGHIRKIESELLSKYFHLNFDPQIKDTCSLSTSTTGTSVSFLHKSFSAYMGDWWMSETVLFTQSKSAWARWGSGIVIKKVPTSMYITKNILTTIHPTLFCFEIPLHL